VAFDDAGINAGVLSHLKSKKGVERVVAAAEQAAGNKEDVRRDIQNVVKPRLMGLVEKKQQRRRG
jgi:hypothetical protein